MRAADPAPGKDDTVVVTGTRTPERSHAAKGSSIAEDLPLFGAWNAATKTLAGPGGYPDAAKYPGVKTEALADGVTGITSGLPYHVYRGTLDTMSKVSLETDASRNAGVVVPFEGGKPALAKAAKLPANVQGEVLVVVAGVTTKKTDAPFMLHIGASDPESVTPDGGTSSASSGGDGCVVARSTSSAGPGAWAALLFCAALGIRRRKSA